MTLKNCSILNFLIYEENLIFFLISVTFQQFLPILPFLTVCHLFLFLERDREREQPGGVHLSDAADPPHPDLQVMPEFLVLLSGLRIRFHKI